MKVLLTWCLLSLSTAFFHRTSTASRFNERQITKSKFIVRAHEKDPQKHTYWPSQKNYYQEYLRRLNNQSQHIVPGGGWDDEDEDDEPPIVNRTQVFPQLTIMIQPGGLIPLQRPDQEDEDDYGSRRRKFYGHGPGGAGTKKKSENFEVIDSCNVTFADIGGYSNVKEELRQCIDILLNYSKYAGYNVRIPKGVILEGPPGNGKTLLAKGFAGETRTSFIPVSGSQFQEKYVGVGSARVRELFDLARRHAPCVVFIDEIDALGRKRSGEGESGSERDNTLNELLIALDGFHTTDGVFLIGATNRADLLDPALLRPGRIDKRIFIGMPDAETRRKILEIHLRGKPHNETSIRLEDMVDQTVGLSGAQIENLLNEAMLLALRHDRPVMQASDVDTVMNKMLVGWQPNEHQFSADIIDRIAIHEMGHAIVGFLSKHHAKVSKVTINLSSPTSPGFTLFQGSTSTIHTKESLFEHLMILLAGRIAEEEFYDVSTTTGASMDFEEAFKLAERMVLYYGMGRNNVIYPSHSDRYRELIDDEVMHLINSAYQMAKQVVKQHRRCLELSATCLKKERVLKIDRLMEIMRDCTDDDNDLPLVP